MDIVPELKGEGSRLQRYFNKQAAVRKGVPGLLLHQAVVASYEFSDNSLMPWMFRLGLRTITGLMSQVAAKAVVQQLEEGFLSGPPLQLVVQGGEYISSLNKTIELLNDLAEGRITSGQAIQRASSVSVLLEGLYQHHPLYSLADQADKQLAVSLAHPLIIGDNMYVARKEYVQRPDTKRWFVTRLALVRPGDEIDSADDEIRSIISFQFVRRLGDFPKRLLPL